ncbi:Aldo keto reductase [Mycena maculata]|uniref:Aldo keto reductase n=1 Tax=Mycena maculata TaxID=230809 RepID=A0AAD7I7D6_9AGAR|nr:Aldo keto reductase [Mycena maculata]
MSIPSRKIGKNVEPNFSEIGFGAMGIARFYGAVESDEERLKVLDAAYNAGCRHWDTAHIYGDSENLIGKWFQRNPGKRSEIFLATKFGVGPSGASSRPDLIKEQLATSLERLGVEYIDLYYQHRIDPQIPIEETVGEMAKLVENKQVRYLGLSECSAKALERAYKVHPISALQIEYSPFVIDIEKNGLLEMARKLEVTIVAYSPLGRGLLTGRFKSPEDFEPDDFRRAIPKYFEANFPNILKLVDKLKFIGEKYDNATAGQVTLAWILAQGPEFVVIPGTKKIQYLEENLRASALTLTTDVIKEIHKFAEAAEADIPGTRYDETRMAGLLLDSPELPK